MRSRKRKEGGIFRNATVQRYLRVLAIPLIVVVLILVIVLVDRPPKSDKQGKESPVVAMAETVSPDGAGASRDPDRQAEGEGTGPDTSVSADGAGNGQSQAKDALDEAIAADSRQNAASEESKLQKDAIPEINALMEAYCSAKASCDAEAMYKIYGRTDMTGVDELREKMKYRSKYIESFQNVACYTRKGLDETSYLVYVTVDIKFRVTDTLAPTLMWCYVTRGDDGNYAIVENVGDDVNDFVAQAEHAEDVRFLASQVKARLLEATSADLKLASAYGLLKEGAEVDETGGQGETQQETQPSAGETAASTEGETQP